MRIFLIGYMGCGKSTLGRKLASSLGLTFIDLDKFIEERYFKTIPKIFAEEGEDGFRDKERRAVEEVSSFENVVVATGGGAPCFFTNMETMNRSGLTVYLSPPPEVLAQRLLASKTDRPLIRGKSEEELKAFIQSTLEKRNPFYQQARLVITKGDDLSPDDLVPSIEEYYKENP